MTRRTRAIAEKLREKAPGHPDASETSEQSDTSEQSETSDMFKSIQESDEDEVEITQMNKYIGFQMQYFSTFLAMFTDT